MSIKHLGTNSIHIIPFGIVVVCPWTIEEPLMAAKCSAGDELAPCVAFELDRMTLVCADDCAVLALAKSFPRQITRLGRSEPHRNQELRNAKIGRAHV